MASELRVDTLKDSSGSNSVGMAYVAGGSAKAWVNYDCASTTPRDSFNVASLSDNGTGYFTTTFTNNMNNDDYSIPTSSNDVNASATLYGLNAHTYATGSVQCDSFEANPSTVQQIDSNHNHIAIFGDLA
jgi:hypothetical protein